MLSSLSLSGTHNYCQPVHVPTPSHKMICYRLELSGGVDIWLATKHAVWHELYRKLTVNPFGVFRCHNRVWAILVSATTMQFVVLEF